MGKKSKREKLGRNDPCHCGSGKKFKRCHGAAESRPKLRPIDSSLKNTLRRKMDEHKALEIQRQWGEIGVRSCNSTFCLIGTAYGDVGAKRNKKRHKTWHGVRRGVNWGHVKTSETVRKLGCTGASVARFPEMARASVNRMVRPKEMTEWDG
jgi:hexokinase